MIIVDSNGRYDRALLDLHITRLRALASDLERLRDGGHPSAEELTTSPSIDQWSMATRPVPCLTGLVQGHPRIEQRFTRTFTSDVWAIDETRGYARTLSRFYSLGLPLGARQDSHQ